MAKMEFRKDGFKNLVLVKNDLFFRGGNEFEEDKRGKTNRNIVHF